MKVILDSKQIGQILRVHLIVTRHNHNRIHFIYKRLFVAGDNRPACSLIDVMGQ